jgi:hypothetical protein
MHDKSRNYFILFYMLKLLTALYEYSCAHAVSINKNTNTNTSFTPETYFPYLHECMMTLI